MHEYSSSLLKKYFEDYSFVKLNIDSFNDFVKNKLQMIVDENKEHEPTVIPQNVDEFKIRLDKIEIKKPEITEADGAKRFIYPNEARLRKLSYSAPIFLEISAHINGVQRESFSTQIGSLPIMLKSDFCHLNRLGRDELIAKGEDPEDPGGYFIINGTEKALISIEDLSANHFFVELASGVSDFTGRVFSEQGSLKIPHTVERMKDGIFYITFTRAKRVPITIVIKSLGLLKDEEIVRAVSEKQFDEVIVNLYDYVGVKTVDDAIDVLAKKMNINQPKDIRVERVEELLDKYLLPHIGMSKERRLHKAYMLCKMLKKYIQVARGEALPDDKDHYMNKRIKLSGDLLADLFRVNLKILVGDLLYNFQRIVKRGKFPSIKVIIRDKLLTSRIYSAMATGSWVGGRKGISQRIQRLDHLHTLSNLQRVVSPLSSSQENFEARELHPTTLGRLCPTETPEGTPIGLRKNLAMMAEISRDSSENDVIKSLKSMGLKAM